MKENKKNMIFVGAIGIFVLLAVVSMANSAFVKPTNNFAVKDNTQSTPAGIQDVKLKVQGSQYIMEPSTLKLGVPVRMEADMSTISGCSRTIVIPGFKVRKTVSTNDNIIEFIPSKEGTFNIACSMNMFQGTFKVEDKVGTMAATGTQSTYVEPLASKGGTCGGASGGGCGCGG